LWKLIVSPESGERAGLKALTRELVSRTEKDVGTTVELVVVAHFNTEHPHFHLALRGIGSEGRPLKLRMELVKRGIRRIAEDLCILQLGHRTELDAAAAQRREVHQHRYTSLDRIIQRDGALSSTAKQAGPSASLLVKHIVEGLKVLESMGLAERTGPDTWRVRQGFENVLRAMQRSVDRQIMLAAHRVLMSDERLALAVLEIRELGSREGRILGHGEPVVRNRIGGAPAPPVPALQTLPEPLSSSCPQRG
jgi:type IV secretory pathway VirD2 relaxase